MAVSPEHAQGIDTVTALTEVLIDHGIDLSLWGRSDTKSVADLVAEVVAGESELIEDEDGLHRIANGLGLDVFATDGGGKRYYLTEDHQEFVDGSILRRNLSTSLGEKIKRGESIEQVVVRALDEELGIRFAEGIAIEIGDVIASERSSNSYPGLRSIVVIHHATVELPLAQFNPARYVEIQEKKSVHLVWRPVDDRARRS